MCSLYVFASYTNIVPEAESEVRYLLISSRWPHSGGAVHSINGFQLLNLHNIKNTQNQHSCKNFIFYANEAIINQSFSIDMICQPKPIQVYAINISWKIFGKFS